MARKIGGEVIDQFSYEVNLDEGTAKLTIYGGEPPFIKQLDQPVTLEWKLDKEELEIAEAAYVEEPTEDGFFPSQAALARIMEEKYAAWCDDNFPAFSLDEMMMLPPF